MEDDPRASRERDEWQEHRRLRPKMLPSNYQTPEEHLANLAAAAAAATANLPAPASAPVSPVHVCVCMCMCMCVRVCFFCHFPH